MLRISNFVPSIRNKAPESITALWREDRLLFVIKLLTLYQSSVTSLKLENQLREVMWLAERRQRLVSAS
jgi:hypothetical protein